jgi:CRP-like cAMP-binding protein
MKRSEEDLQLAQFSGMVLDVPPRVRLALGIAAVIGVGLVVMQSLIGYQAGTIRIDKVIHFSGYAILAATFVLALRPALFLPVLGALLGVSYGIELLQPLTGRERDIFDAAANTLGVAVGAGAGLFIRVLYAWLRRDLALSAVSQKRVRCGSGVVLVREGDPVNVLHIIKSGEAKLTRLVDGLDRHLATLGPGDVIGLMGAIQGVSQYATVTALSPMTLYRLTLDELFATAGGAQQPIVNALQTAARVIRSLAERRDEPDSGFTGEHAS